MTQRRQAPSGELKLDSAWSARYIRCMRKVWSYPNNDQRAAVLEWLPSIVPAGSVIVDIGTGDGYYAAVLRPRRYLFVEPVSVLFGRCATSLADAGVEAQGFRTVAELFESRCWESADIVLLVHALLYLTPSELELVAKMASRRSCAIVYPDPDGSTTVAFEDETERGWSRKIVAHKERILGTPTTRQRANTHFRFRQGTRTQDVAFVVSHLLLREPETAGLRELALAHVRAQRAVWRKDTAGWEVPQAQLMEYWSTVSLRKFSGDLPPPPPPVRRPAPP